MNAIESRLVEIFQIRLCRVRFEIGYMHQGMQHHRRTSSVLSLRLPSTLLTELHLHPSNCHRLSVIM
ncbi:hypothetical protein PUN28_011450 [Cardiocondyla obscurior]|uniref:Uncharacterized protein n=1 Tax=Cardiocondyla obscurior TaxID=286306 RepID=A0AAW2FH92_9HYME